MTLGGLIVICGTVIIVAAITGTTIEKCRYYKRISEEFETFIRKCKEEE